MERLLIPRDADKDSVFDCVGEYLGKLSLKIDDTDKTRPWGGSIYIDDHSTEEFIDAFFPNVDKSNIYKYGRQLSPKLLLVGPHQSLSWQYHNRRAEIWKVLVGPVGIMRSTNDTPPVSPTVLGEGDVVVFDKQERHRLIGLDDWGVVTEIWQHTDHGYPTDEEDIVRLQDTYGRT